MQKYHPPMPNSNTLSTSSFTDEEVLLISHRVTKFISEYLVQEVASFLVKYPSGLDTLLKTAFKNDFRVTMVDVRNKQRYAKWWQGIFKKFLFEVYQDHKNIDHGSLESLHNHNMSTAFFILNVVGLGNRIIPSPIKEILEFVCERQRYLFQFLPHTASHQDELNLAINQDRPQDNFDNCITIIANRAIKQNIEVKPNAARALKYDEVYPSKMWPDDTKELEHTLRKNIHDVSSWAAFGRSSEAMDGKDGTVYRHKNFNQDTSVDYVLLHLLSIVTLYSTENSLKGVNDPSKIERLQTQYLNLLHKYLQARYHHDAYARLARGMDVISKARESCKILNLFDSWLSPMK
jgi:hypothetical protein